MRSFSVVINTYNRAESLARTLSALEQVDHRAFEVVVVNGPSTDGTEHVLSDYARRVKIGRCDERNLSRSRNVGIKLSAGEVVAFIDDDACPDPGWLDVLASAYDDPEVAAAGGPVYDFTGFRVQAWNCSVDRFGNVSVALERGEDLTDYVCAPGIDVIPYNIGTNSSFRRQAITDIGGFDETFAFYLDECDVARRLVDAGWVIRRLDDGFVHHKFLPSATRERHDVVKDHYELLKSKFYFALKHGFTHGSFAAVSADLADFVRSKRTEVERALQMELIEEGDRRKFERDVHLASNAGFEAFVTTGPRTRPVSWFSDPPSFMPFPTLRPAAGKLHLCFLSQEYPPSHVNGIGRVVHLLATGLAEEGHFVHVLTRGAEYPTVDLEDRVWVHRLPLRRHELPAGIDVPPHIWDHAATMRDELERIDRHRPVDLVQVPNWDSEGVALLTDDRFEVVVGLYTPLKTVTCVDPGFAQALDGPDPVLRQLIDLERFTYSRADGFLACGDDVVEEVERQYGLGLDRARVGLVPHGITDSAERHETAADRAPDGLVRVLFVGRLEARKGIDTLLASVPGLVERYPDLFFTIVGDDALAAPSGKTYRQIFEDSAGESVSHVRFAGIVDDDELRQLYAGCDLLVAPSRYESFGLILLEAMLFAKPVVAGDVGGMRDIVIPHVTGLLVPPGDEDALSEALAALAESQGLRHKLGEAGRRRYEELFTQKAMVHGAEAYYRRLLGLGLGRGRRRTPAPSRVEESVGSGTSR